jgi:CHAT domain-containing protein
VVAHGYFDQLHPSLSYLQFQNSQVMAVDLPKFGLDGALVTLTSCNTGQLWQYGQGRAAGDDQIGLGRMFLYAGASALVTSQWEIGDGLTLSLLERFYAGLLAGEATSAALRRAQLGLLEMLPNLHPVFWGAYQLVGAYAPVHVMDDNEK